MSDSDQLAHGKALLDLALQNPAENEPALAQRVGQTLQFGNEHTNEVFLTKAGEILVRFIQPVQ